MSEECNSILDELIENLNTLIPFIATSHLEVFELLQNEKQIWFLENPESLPETYSIYQRQVINSALLLGFSYFEVFLADIAREAFKARPERLPSERKVTYKELLALKDYSDVLDLLIQQEISALFYKSMKDILNYFQEKLDLNLADELKEKVIEGAYVRNCIIHNKSVVDTRLANCSHHIEGEPIIIGASVAHTYGLYIREIARRLHSELLRTCS